MIKVAWHPSYVHPVPDGHRFPMEKYEHLTYFCRTSTASLDTCNVKLFKMQDMLKEEEEKKTRKWAPPFS